MAEGNFDMDTLNVLQKVCASFNAQSPADQMALLGIATQDLANRIGVASAVTVITTLCAHSQALNSRGQNINMTLERDRLTFEGVDMSPAPDAPASLN